MPQLNPTPWFIVFLTVWIALMLYYTKAIKLQQPFTPLTHQMPDKKPTNWQWP